MSAPPKKGNAVIKGFFKKAKKSETASEAAASSAASASATSLGTAAATSLAASDAWVDEPEGPSTTDVLPSKLGQRVAELSLDEIVDAEEEVKSPEADNAWSAASRPKAAAPAPAPAPAKVNWRERQADRAAGITRVDLKSQEAFPSLGGSGGPSVAVPAPAPSRTAWGANKFAGLSTDTDAVTSSAPSAESPSSASPAHTSAAAGSSGVAGGPWKRATAAPAPAPAPVARSAAVGGAGSSAPAPAPAAKIDPLSVTEGDLVNTGSKAPCVDVEGVKKEAGSIMRELIETHNVAEAVTRFTELRCSPVFLRSHALHVLVFDTLEAPTTQARVCVGKVLSQLVVPAKAVTVAWIRAAFAKLFEPDYYGDMRSDYPMLDAYMADVLSQGAVPSIIPVDMLPPSVASRMGLAAPAPGPAPKAAAPAPAPAPAPTPVAPVAASSSTGSAASAATVEGGDGDDGFLAAAVKKKKKAIKTFGAE